ncbi:MarR family winged helix-turn-helix transcriptional regulator [Psychrobacillus sp. OK032]|uniref:MarR family winged helix-turn-helix transcriptional regulator n=1 Tax=Psychrobacillus sp. OK032 TaxID=1884358 RepID=UPI0008D770C2|nr:MarR family transcriptional regulator [Psychrobacillus sp. OK032]SES44140.1 DNA-binding transcriptional regulator, MarR family [Psychrobacillus sp. OK032]
MVDNEIREHIDKISSQMRRQYSEALRELDLHVGQDNLLCKLWTADDITQMQLTELLNCEPSTVTNMVKTLEKKGFVYRKKDPVDGRVSRVYLTEKGLAVREPITQIWRKQQDKLLKGLTAENRELLNKFLQQMEKNLR